MRSRFVWVHIYAEVKEPLAAEKDVKAPVLPLRPAVVFCTISEIYEDPEIFWDKLDFPCDYVIYTDLIALGDELLPLFGNKSWASYLKLLGDRKQQIGGASIPLAEGTGVEETLKLLPKLKPKIVSLYAQRLLAVGTFDYNPSLFDMAHLREFYKILDETRREEADALFFLGVVLTSRVMADDFVLEVATIEVLNTIVFQTHIMVKSDALYSNVDCHTYPISAMGSKNLANSSRPTLDVAEHAVNRSRSAGDHFRVMFSSTMGVMVYSAKENKSLSRFRQPCKNYRMGDSDTICETKDFIVKFEETDLSEFATDKNGTVMFVYDGLKSIKAKLERYLPFISDGWCMFDIQRDVYWACTDNPPPLVRVETAYNMIKSFKRGYGIAQ